MNITTLFRSTLLTAILSLSCVAQAQVTFNLTAGWNLLGNCSAAPIDVATTFGDTSKVTTVWKWNKTASKWAFYTPLMSNVELQAYVSSRGYEILSSIPSKDGYWINVPSSVSITTPEGNSFIAGSELQTGWNLVGSTTQTAAQLAASLNSTLSGGYVSTIWGWNATTSKWKFYSTELAAQGGTELSIYQASKGYENLNSVTGLDGVWVNVTSVPIIDPTTVKLDCLTEYINPTGWEVGATGLAPPINAAVNDDYSIAQGPWGSRNISGWSLCTGAVMANSNKVTGRITWDYGSISLQPNWVVSYPNISFGNIPGHTNPVTVANFPAPIAITKSIIATWDVEMRNVTGTGNTAFDIWISSDGKADTVAYGKSTTVMELMIRTDSRGNYTKWAEIFPNDPTVVIDGVAYQYHFDPVAPMVNDVRSDYINPTMATFIAKQTITKGSVDIMSFIKFLQGKGLLTNEYIQNIEFGMELATGKGEMLINSYSVTVN